MSKKHLQKKKSSSTKKGKHNRLTKKCRRCGNQKNRNDFVDISGEPNPRGHFCNDCYEEREKEVAEIVHQNRESKVRKYKIIYGDYWLHYATPHHFSSELYKERDFCPYCGIPLPPEYLSQEKQKHPFRDRAHIDHMDPLSKGGEDSIRNAVYVCDRCNYAKGDSLFLDWLKRLEPRYRKLAVEIYYQKHGHKPEDFKPGNAVPRTEGVYYELGFEEDELKKMYPTPKVDGPPKELVIEIDPLKILNEPKNWSLNIKFWAIAARDRLKAQVKDAKKIAKRAKGALIFPKVENCGITVNGEYEKGILVVRGEKSFEYYNMIPGSVDLPVRGQTKDIILYFMSDDVLKSFQTSEEWKEGVDGRITLITVDTSENDLSAMNKKSIVAFVFDDNGLISDMSIKGAKFIKIYFSNG